MRHFVVHRIERGLIELSETREDGTIIGLPVALPVGSRLKDDRKVSWIVLRQVGKRVGLNRRGARVGMRFHLSES